MMQHLGLLNSSCCFLTINNHNTTKYEKTRGVFSLHTVTTCTPPMGIWGDDAVVFVFINYWPDKSQSWPTFTYSLMEMKFVGGMQMTPA